MSTNSFFTQKILKILKDYCEVEHQGNIRAASVALGLDPDTGTLNKWLNAAKGNKNARFPRLDTLGPCMDIIGAKVFGPGETPWVPATKASFEKFAQSQRDLMELHVANPLKQVCEQQQEKMQEALKKSIREQEELLMERLRRERDEARGAATVLERLLQQQIIPSPMPKKEESAPLTRVANEAQRDI